MTEPIRLVLEFLENMIDEAGRAPPGEVQFSITACGFGARRQRTCFAMSNG
jgi:hypothetical protein